MIRIKPGADLSNMHPMMWWAIFQVESIYDAEDLYCVVTAGRDGTHKPGSLHYALPLCKAADLRTRMIRRKLGEEIGDRIRAKLGKDFDVVVHIVDGEVHHIHVEYQPKAITHA